MLRFCEEKGLIRSAFRPSDDATVYQFLVPSNAFVSVALLQLSDVVRRATPLSDSRGKESLGKIFTELRDLGEEVKLAVWKHGVVEVTNAEGGKDKVFAYEVDGFGTSFILPSFSMS